MRKNHFNFSYFHVFQRFENIRVYTRRDYCFAWYIFQLFWTLLWRLHVLNSSCMLSPYVCMSSCMLSPSSNHKKTLQIYAEIYVDDSKSLFSYSPTIHQLINYPSHFLPLFAIRQLHYTDMHYMFDENNFWFMKHGTFAFSINWFN